MSHYINQYVIYPNKSVESMVYSICLIKFYIAYRILRHHLWNAVYSTYYKGLFYSKIILSYICLPFVAHLPNSLIDDIKTYNKINDIKKELSAYSCKNMHLIKPAHAKASSC